MDEFLVNLKVNLDSIKDKLDFDSKDIRNKFLNNYSEDNSVNNIIDILTKTDYRDIKGKLFITLGIIEGKPTLLPEEINYISLLEDAPNYSVGIFFMPKDSVIPLHDHTDLMVISKCLFGKLEIISYDKAKRDEKNM